MYYDRDLDVLRVPVEGVGPVEESDGVELNAQRPPEGIFEPAGGVLVRHGGEEKLVAEEDLERHLAHGDVMIDPTGRAGKGKR